MEMNLENTKKRFIFLEQKMKLFKNKINRQRQALSF